MSHEILEPIYIREDERGIFRELIRDIAWYTVITGKMNQGSVMGHHYHRKTMLFFHIIRGSVTIRTIHVETKEMDKFALHDSQSMILPTHQAHSIFFEQNTDFLLLKSLSYDPQDPDTYPFQVPTG